LALPKAIAGLHYPARQPAIKSVTHPGINQRIELRR
jgi:hypothetical protein